MEELRAASKGPSDPGPLKGLQLFFTGLLGSRSSAIAETVRYAPPPRRLITGQWGISGGETFVAVVQSTHLRERDDLAWFCQMDRAGIGAILFSERCVRVRW
jgi:hypothetical protein